MWAFERRRSFAGGAVLALNLGDDADTTGAPAAPAKDSEASPYINHPIAVATVLAAEAGVADETSFVAALLHDAVEDKETRGGVARMAAARRL